MILNIENDILIYFFIHFYVFMHFKLSVSSWL